MNRRPLADTILSLAITTFLAASNAEGKDESNEWGREDSGTVSRTTHYSRGLCYDPNKQSLKCWQGKVVIVACVVGVAFAIFAVWAIWVKVSEWRKKRKAAEAEEHESLSEGAESDSDCERAIPKGSKNKDKKNDRDDNNGGHAIHSFDKSEEASLSRSSSYSNLPSYEHDRPPGLTQPDAYPVAFPSYRVPSTRF